MAMKSRTVRTEKIENGYLLHESCDHGDSFSHKTTFSKTEPDIYRDPRDRQTGSAMLREAIGFAKPRVD